jgi:hypothetical protein
MECRLIKSLSETHNQEIAKIKKRTNVIGTIIEKLSEVMKEVSSDYKQTKQSARE